MPMCKIILLHFAADPFHQKAYDPVLLVLRECSPDGNTVPFVHTAPAAAGAAMHSLKYGMPAHGRLLSVIFRIGRGKPLPYEISCVSFDNGHALLFYVSLVLSCQIKAGSKF